MPGLLESLIAPYGVKVNRLNERLKAEGLAALWTRRGLAKDPAGVAFPVPETAGRRPAEAGTAADLDRLQGEWWLAELQICGKKLPEAQLGGGRIEITGKRFSLVNSSGTYEGTLEIDSGARPKAMTFLFERDGQTANSNGAIFELTGDVWSVCLNTKGAEIPKAFEAPVTGGFAIEIFRRV